MFLLFFLSCIILTQALGFNSTTSTMYVFAYTWTPEFCYGTTYPGCSTPQTYWKTHFTVHGLWPQYTTTGYPSFCTTEPFDSTVPTKIGWSTMTQYWPNVQAIETSSTYTSFWDHEWTKHGTCSGLTQVNYFNNTINLIKKYGTPLSLQNAVGKTLPKSTLQADMGGANYVSLQCTGGKFLNGAYSCWSQSSGVPGVLSPCPAEVLAEDTCSSATLTIQAL